jgi:vitamin B12 transporter
MDRCLPAFATTALAFLVLVLGWGNGPLAAAPAPGPPAPGSPGLEGAPQETQDPGHAVPAGDRRDDGQEKTNPALRHDIVVTATRVETPGREVASSITVITASELARTGKTTVLEALRDLAGLSILQNGGPGAAASVSIRGANTEHTLVLLDGLELNDPINPSRSCDLAHLTLTQVERLEILRGPQGPLYGSDALGGVINIITREGQGRPRFSLAGSAGGYGTYGAEAGFSGAWGRADYSFGLSGDATRGVSAASAAYSGNGELDGYRNLTAFGRVGLAVGRNTRIAATFRAVAARTEIDNFGGSYGDDPNNVQDYASTLARLQARSLFLGGRWEQRFSVSWIGSRRRNRNPVDDGHPFDSESGLYESGLARLDWQNNLFLSPSHTATAGVELGRETGSSEYTSASEFGPYRSAFPSRRTRAAGVYVQDQWKVAGRFFLAAGARFDAHSRTRSALTYRIAPAYIIGATGTKLKATIGTGFKSPSLYQLFAPATEWGAVGNPGLRPERAAGWDAGFEQDLAGGRVRFGLTWFSTAFRDLIDFDFSAGYINIGRALTRGIEALIESRPAKDVRIRASYTRLEAEDRTTGEALLRRPRDKFSAEIQSRLGGRFDTVVSVLYVGRRPDTDFSAYPYAPVSLPGYILLNAIVSTRVGPALELFLRLDNVLDARYETVRGYGTMGFAANAGFRLGM